MSADDDFGFESRDEQTRDEFEQAHNLAPSLDEARTYLAEHDAEASINHDNAKVVYSPPYLAAAAAL
jgi:hypothetical protein